jgi:L-asparagine oxygenase
MNRRNPKQNQVDRLGYATHANSAASIEVLEISKSACEAISRHATQVAREFPDGIEKQSRAMANAGASILEQFIPEGTAALRKLSQFGKTVCVHLKGVAELPVPATPTSGSIDDRKIAAHDLVLAGALRIAGTDPIAFDFENSGLIARNVVANPAGRGKASSHGFDVMLFWHQDNCGQPFKGEPLDSNLPPMPVQLAFAGIRNHEQVPTRVLLVDDLLAIMPTAIRDILAQPLFRIGAPDSVAADGNGNLAIQNAPILRMDGSAWKMRYDPNLVTASTDAACAANEWLKLALSICKEKARDIIVNAGDLLVFQNYQLMHMRVAFEPLAPEQSRWLRRFYGS